MSGAAVPGKPLVRGPMPAAKPTAEAPAKPVAEPDVPACDLANGKVSI